MSSQANLLSPQFLAEHQHFVRRLAMGLARDEASAEDLMQETWLAAMASGTQAIVHPRAWLATLVRRRALNLARDQDTRREHETKAARAEASEDARLHERVSFQHSIVAAVLELNEPYRSVVMLRYFQGLSPASIARRRKIPAATVRSQLSRAHGQLRERLEERAGGREAWCLALAGFLDHSRPILVSSQVLAISAGACVMVGGIGGAWVWTHRMPTSTQEIIVLAEPVVQPSRIVEPSLESARVAVMASGVELTPAAAEEGPSNAELGAKSLDELTDMLTRVEDELRGRLLTPPADVVAAWKARHSDAQMEFARVLDRSVFKAGFDSGSVGIRGGGAYYSFVTRSNSYDDEPTIGLADHRFLASFYGGTEAVLVDVGKVDPSDIPEKLSRKEAKTYETLSRGPAFPASNVDSELKSLLEDRRRVECALKLQHTYLLRQGSASEHDVLAVFVPIHQDKFGVTLAWRVLQNWPVPDRSEGPKIRAERKALAPEAWTALISTDGLLLLLGRIRVIITSRLMAIPDALVQQVPKRPIARLLRDYWGARFVNIDGGGRFYNFATRSNDYQDAPDIALEGEALSGAANTGRPTLLMDLGVASVQDVTDQFAPPTDETARRVWDLAWTYERRTPSPRGEGHAIVTAEEFQLMYSELRGGGDARAIVGHTYLVRSIIPGAHDHLVAFEILAEDEHGIFITWRIVKTWPA